MKRCASVCCSGNRRPFPAVRFSCDDGPVSAANPQIQMSLVYWQVDPDWINIAWEMLFGSGLLSVDSSVYLSLLSPVGADETRSCHDSPPPMCFCDSPPIPNGSFQDRNPLYVTDFETQGSIEYRKWLSRNQ